MNPWRLARVVLRNWWVWVLPAIAAAALAWQFTDDLPRSYTSSALVSVGIFEPTTFISNQDSRPPDYFRTGAAVDLLQSKIKHRDALARAALDLFTVELNAHLAALRDGKPAPGTSDPRGFPGSIGTHLRTHSPVPYTVEGLESLHAAIAKWDPNTPALANDPASLQDDIQAMLEDPRFPLSLPEIAKRLSTRREGVADMVRIEMTGSDPELLYRFLGRLVSNHVAETERDRRESSRQAVRFVEEKVEEAKKSLAAAEQALREFQTSHGISNYYEQAKYFADQRQKMYLVHEEHAAEAEGLTRSITELEKLLGGDPRSPDLARQDQDLQEELLRQRMELARRQAEFDLDTNLGAVPPEQARKQAGELEARRVELEKAMEDFWSRQFISLGAQRKDLLVQYYELLVRQATASRMSQVANEQLEKFQREMDAFAPLGADLKKLEREADLRSGVYLDLQREANRAQTSYEAAIQTSAMRIEQPPNYPMRPQASKRKFMVAGAGVIPAMAGILLVLAFAFFDPSLRTPVLAATHLGLRVAGGLPWLGAWATRREAARLPGVLRRAGLRLLVRGASAGASTLVPIRAGRQATRVHAILSALAPEAGVPAPLLLPDLAGDPVALQSLPAGANVVLLWPMRRRPSSSDRAILDDVLARVGADRVQVLVVSLDGDASEEFLGERPPLFLAWRR